MPSSFVLFCLRVSRRWSRVAAGRPRLSARSESIRNTRVLHLNWVPALVLLLVPASAASQIAGRWALHLTGGIPPTLHGELRLKETRGALSGTLALDNTDAPFVLQNGWIDRDGAVAFVAGAVVFRGHWSGDAMDGVATAGDSLPREWSATRLAEVIEYYPTLPRFTLHQIIAGTPDKTLRLPGPVAALALARGALPAVDTAYRGAASAAGISALLGGDLEEGHTLRAMGVWQRGAMVDAARATLQAVRGDLTDPRSRAHFDGLFHPKGQWLTDIHDAALFHARLERPGTTWAAALPALVAADLLPALADSAEAVPLALYRLYVLAETDSLAYRRTLDDMMRADAKSAAAVAVLIIGYQRSAPWYIEAMQFFLGTPWLAGSGQLRSLTDLVREAWHSPELVTPTLDSHVFGYPQAAPRVGVPQLLFDRLVTPENGPAGEWLERHGRAEFLRLVRRLAPVSDTNTVIVTSGGSLRLTTVRREADEHTNGFLEPEDVLLLDPSYSPLLALGTLLHEWQHVLFERERLRLEGIGWRRSADGTITLIPGSPFLSEGVAEWMAEQILGSVAARHPLLAVGEAEKRAVMAHEESDDPHLLGYLTVRGLARSGAPPRELIRLLVRHSNNPSGLLREPSLARVLAPYRGTHDRTFPSSGYRVLIPETRFTIEDRYPDLVEVRVVVPRQ
jgi:hypothetical protein